MEAQICHQDFAVVKEILGICARTMTPAQYSRIGQIMREEVAQPVDTAVCRPCLHRMSVQAVDSDDTAA